MNGSISNISGSYNNSSNPPTASDPSVMAQVGLALLYIFGITVGTTGNVLVVIAVAANRSMRTGTNFFIASLSVADLLVTALCMPPFFVYNVFTWPIWPFGRGACRTLSYLVHTSVMASALSLLCISYDRFVSVYFPLKRLQKPNKAVAILCVIWLASPLLLLASVFHHDVFTEKHGGQTFVVCKEWWPTQKQLRDYQAYRVSFYFLFVLQISVVYALIGHRLFKRQQPGVQSDKNKTRSLLHKRKVIKMLVLVIACFSLSWLPYIVNKLFAIFPPSPGFKASDMFVFVGNLLGLLNSCVNPILYAVLNRNFRTAFKNALRCKCNSDTAERRRMVHTETLLTRHGDVKKTEKHFYRSKNRNRIGNQNELAGNRQMCASDEGKSLEYLSFEAYNDLPPERTKSPQEQQASFKTSELFSSPNGKRVEDMSELEEESIEILKEKRKAQDKGGRLASLRGSWTRRVGTVEESLDMEDGISNIGLSAIPEQSCENAK